MDNKVEADTLIKGDTIRLGGVFYKVLERRPDGKDTARFQLETLVGSVIQIDMPKNLLIGVFR